MPTTSCPQSYSSPAKYPTRLCPFHDIELHVRPKDAFARVYGGYTSSRLRGSLSYSISTLRQSALCPTSLGQCSPETVFNEYSGEFLAIRLDFGLTEVFGRVLVRVW